MPCRFVGLHDYPLCQNGQWISSVSASLYLMDAGVLDGSSWLTDDVKHHDQDEAVIATLPRAAVHVIGRQTAAWNPYVYASPIQ
jgi:hypothetical protein